MPYDYNKYNPLSLNHNDTIGIPISYFAGWFKFQNEADHCITMNKVSINFSAATRASIKQSNLSLYTNLNAARLSGEFSDDMIININRDIATTIWSAYHEVKDIDSSILNSKLELIIDTIKAFCLNRDLDKILTN